MKRPFLVFIIVAILSVVIYNGVFLTRHTSAISREKPDYVVIYDDIVPLDGQWKLNHPMCNNIVDGINKEREAAGLVPLNYSTGLSVAAATRAEEITHKFSHTRPDGTEWWTVEPNICFGENLAEHYQSGSEVVDAWMDSPSHKAIILDDEFSTVGVGIYEKAGGLYVAAEFGY